MIITKEVNSHTIVEIALDAGDIFTLLSRTNALPHNALLEDIGVFFNVPRGGDYSGLSIDIDKDCPIIVQYKATAKEED